MTIGVLASGEGTTLQRIIDACAAGRIPARVAVVISNNSGAGALVRAQKAGIATIHLSSKTHPQPDALDAAIRDALREVGVDLVFLAGYMKPLGPLTLAEFGGRILNTHPALLPRHGGPGMFGDRVHAAVLAAGDRESGVSIHVVNERYDDGPVVARSTVPVLPDDTLDTLKARVQACEREFVVDTLAAIAREEIVLTRFDR